MKVTRFSCHQCLPWCSCQAAPGPPPGSPFVGISLRFQGMDQASPKAWWGQPKQTGFIGTEPISAPRATALWFLGTPARLHSSQAHLGSPPALQKIWGNGRHEDKLKNSITYSSFENRVYRHWETISKGSLWACTSSSCPSPVPWKQRNYFSCAGSRLVQRKGRGSPFCQQTPRWRPLKSIEHFIH